MTGHPAITVLMPVYNAGRFVSDAVQSILAQTFQDFEFLIIDDGSADGTGDVVAGFRDERIHLVRRPHAGLVAQLNFGIEEAAAPLIARMDADDISDPRRLEVQYRFMQDNPSIGVISSWYVLRDDRKKTSLVKRLPEADVGVRSMLPVFCPFVHSSVMYRKEIVQQAGGYSAAAFPNEDYELWLRLSGHTSFANIGEPLLIKRKHAFNITVNAPERASGQRLQIAMAFLDAKENSGAADAAEIAFLRAKVQYYYGSMKEVRRLLQPLLSIKENGLPVRRYYLPALLGDRFFRTIRRLRIPDLLFDRFRGRGLMATYFSR
jgi:glycosyltransferase involved in cell wall biosynthesis